MPNLYYTTISVKQIDILKYMKAKGLLCITDTKMKYLYQLAKQGGGFARDKQEEEFRVKMNTAIQAVFKKEYKTADSIIDKAFRNLCASRSSKLLDKVREEMEKAKNQKEDIHDNAAE